MYFTGRFYQLFLDKFALFLCTAESLPKKKSISDIVDIFEEIDETIVISEFKYKIIMYTCSVMTCSLHRKMVTNDLKPVTWILISSIN